MELTQETLATLATQSAGIIHFTAGQVQAIRPDGSSRSLQFGDTVFRDEIIVTGTDGVIHIDLIDGEVLELGNSDEINLLSLFTDEDPQLLETLVKTSEETIEEAELSEAQQAILAGADPQSVLPAPTAGEQVNSGTQANSGFSSQDNIEISSREVNPEAGYTTFSLLSGTQENTDNLSDEIIDINNAAVITGDDSGAVQEDGNEETAFPSITTGNLNHTDVDQNNNNDVFLAVTSPQVSESGYGTYTITDDGQWTYDLNNELTEIQQLAEGEQLTDSFVVFAQDGTEKTVVIEIFGTNDAPVVSVDTDSGSITEDNSGTLEASGSLLFTDVDQNDVPTISASYNNNASWSGGTLSAGQIAELTSGTFSVDSDSWDYTVASTVADFLGQDETVSFSYLITVSDGKGDSDRETVTITLTGSNDAPVLTVDTGSGSITEDNSGTLEATGSLSFTDVDQNDEPTISASYNDNAIWSGGTLSAGQIAALTVGTFSVDSDSWDYTVASTVADFLGQDETVSFSYLITVSDGKGGSDRETVTITLTGSNDAPVLTVDTGSGSITEDNSGTLEATGSLSFTDVDQNDEPTISASYNDNAIWSGGTLSAGQIAALTGGTFSVDSDSWDYTVASTVADFLGQDETVSFSYLITVSDGKGGSDRETVTITLTGSNDAPVLTVDTGSGSITEDNSGTLEATGSLSFTDVDQNDEPTISASYNNNASWSGGTLSAGQIAALTSGTFSVDSDSWDYTVASTVADFLGQDETVSFSYLITVSDGKGGSDRETVTITLTGSNDAPVLTVDTGSGSITEDNSGTLEATGSLSFTDVDQNDEPTISASYNNNASWSGGTLSAGQIAALTGGTFSVDSDSWDYTVASTVADFLGQDETVSFSYLITVSDGKGGSDRETVTITLTGSNDAPVLTVDTGSGSITEDNSGILEATGSLSFTDVDQNDEPTISASYNNNASWSGGTLSAGQIAALTVGTFSVDSDSWDYTVASTVADFLGQDETVSFSYLITVSDGKGGSDRETVTITLTGTNDVPVLTVDTHTGSITEDNSGTLGASGNLSFTDVDQNDEPTISASYNDNAIWSGGTLSAGQIAALTGGTFSVDSDSWDYTVASTVADFLGQDETVSFSYLITVSDGKGGSDRETVTITLTGTNDAPVLSADTVSGSITEDNSGTLEATGSLSFTDVDQNDEPTISASYNDNAIWSGGTLSAGQIAALTGGTFSVDSDSWDYTVASTVADFLGQDETVIFSYLITVSDGKGGSDRETVTITLTGSNDAPVLSVDTGSGSITEDNSGTLEATGSLSFTDVDQNDEPTISASYNNNASWSGGTLSAGQIAALTSGTFSVDSDSWDYTVASTVADFLGQNETVSFSYDITVSDGNGGSDTETVTITLTGSNDAPVLTVDTDSGLITEDNSGTLVASGSLSFSDVDQNDEPTISASYQGDASWSGGTLSAEQIAGLTSGTFSVDSDSWDYTVASTVADFLGQNETVSFSYDITVSDGNGGSDTETVTITLTGSNDAPVLTVDTDSGLITEDNSGTLVASGSLSFSDVDQNDEPTISASYQGDASWSGGTLSAEQIAGLTSGTFSVDSDSWDYTVASIVADFLGQNETVSFSYLITVSDGKGGSDTETVTITLTGSNDAPVLTVDTGSGSITEDNSGTLEATGSLSFTDVDQNDEPTISASYNDNAIWSGGTLSAGQIAALTVGTFSVDSDSWDYTVASTVADFLGQDETVSFSYHITVSDGKGGSDRETVTITLTGSNDAPVLTVDTGSGSITEDNSGTLEATGSLSFTDVDQNDEPTISASYNDNAIWSGGTLSAGQIAALTGGTFSVDSDSWDYTVASTVADFLGQDETVSFSYLITVSDGKGGSDRETVTITLTGSNDAPVLTVDTGSGSITEDNSGTLEATGSLSFTDVDQNDEPTISASYNNNASWSGGTLSAGQIAALTSGTFSVDSDSWDYTVASTVADFLGQDETVSFSYLITVSDGKGGSDRETVTITLTGSNDAPVLTVDTGSGSITEDNSGTLEATGSLSFTDVDQNDEPTISASYNNNASWSGGTLSAGQIAALTGGTFSVDSDSWDYTVASTVADFLGQDETVSFSYLITVSDGKGGSDRETVTITLTGSNDAPVLTVDTGSGSITEDNSGILEATGSLSFTDVDQNDEPTISASYNNNASWSGGTLSAGQIAALTVGTFSVDSDSWDYTVASTVADFLGQDETVSFSYLITVSDGKGGSDRETVTITLTGTNDVPVLTVDTHTGSITEDNSGTLGASGNLSFTDVDQNDEPTISASYNDNAIWSGGTLSAGQIAALTGGTFSVDSDSWDYTVASTVADFLGQDETVSFSYLITVSDGKGGSDRETVTITLTGTNDAPVLSADTVSGSITEDNSGTLEATGSLSFTDVDQNDEPTISASYNDNAIWSGGTLSAGQIAALTGGTFSVDSDSWDYTVASTVADFLGQDETVSFSYLITVSDGKGGSDRETVTITLTGSNDAPVLSVDTGSGSITEDNSGTLEATGSLSFTDVDQNDEPTISASYNNNASWSGGTLSAGQIAALTSGTFSVDSDSWDYTVASTVADFLGQDETVSFSYLITVSDGKGGSDRETVTITLTGSNDAPVLTVDTGSGSITEDNSGTLEATGSLSFTDVDQNDEPTISASYNDNAIWSGGTLSAGQIAALTSGTFSVDSDSWDYTVASTVADFLGQDETVSFSYLITVSDGKGGSDRETVTITLTGSNDAPVLTVDTGSGSITEDNSGTLEAAGSLSFTDVDQNDEPTISASYNNNASWSGGTLSAGQIAALTSGTFSVDSDSWDYTVASTVADFLGQDETVSFSYNITVSDGKGGSDTETVTITLTGSNDAPVLTVDTVSGSITEDNSGTLEASGNLSFTDVDQNDEPTISASYNNNASWSGGTLSPGQIAALTVGTFSVDSDSWDYTVASTVADFLGQDETVSFSYLITVSDGKGGSDRETVTITLTGTNDVPVLTVDTHTGSITEDNSGTLGASGNLSFTDVDQNDEPTISASYNDNAIWSSGTLSAGQIAALTSGTFSVDSDSWDYTVASTVADFLGQDETVSFSYLITVSDGKGGSDTETVTITLTGSNDAPVLTVDTGSGSITEDNSGTLEATGSLSFTDVDQNDEPTISASYNNNASWSGGTLSAGQIAALTSGTFSVDSDSWDYTVASTVADFLGQDETVSFSYLITVSDGKGGSDRETVTITLTGTNDVPVLTVDTHTGSITEDNSGTLGASGNLSFTDVDQNDEPTISASYNDNAIWSGGTLSAGQIAALTSGTFSVDSDSWDYTVASTVADFLGQDETVSFSYLITVSDGKGGSDRETVTITLTGTNDVPVLTVDTHTGSITEDNSGTLGASGNLSFTDVDQNDEPTISASYNDNAIWSGGTLSAEQIAGLTSGTFSVDSDSWDYTVASTVADFLGQDETVSFSYDITVSDGNGGSDTETVTITLTGSNDAPVLTVDTDSGLITEDNSGTLGASGNLSFTDVDQNDEPTISASYNNNASWSDGTLSAGQIAALTVGTFSVDSDSWDYTVASTVADFLGQDETVSFSYLITVSDGKGGSDRETVTITLTGSNDAPVLTVDTGSGSITEDNSGTLEATGSLSFTDEDQNDEPTISASYNNNASWSGGTLSAGQIAALTSGTFSVDSDSWDYTVASTVADFLGQDETVSFSYLITVSDGKGGSDRETVTITLTGSNDAPVLTVDTGSGSITEDNSGTLETTGSLSFTDVDQNDVPTISASYNNNASWSGGTLSAEQIAGLTSGTFSVDSDSWDYTVASTVADFLGQNETVSFSYDITVSDGNGGSDTETVTITLTGSNDAPVLTVDTDSGLITEDNSGSLGASGNLSFTDVDQNDEPTISASYNNNASWSGGTLSAGQIAALTVGTFSVDSDSWDYTVASTVADFLGQDETVSFSYLITVSDGKGGSDRETVTITLTGTNDVPVLTVDTHTGSITEDNSGTLGASGNLSFTDVDQNDEPTISASYNDNAIWSGGTLSAGQIAALTGGTFSVDSDSWDYTVASTVADFLGQDETVSFSYLITVSDGKGGSDRETVTITLTGTNDAPVLSADTVSGSITEDNSGTLEATGSLSFTDVDQNDEPTISASYNDNAIWSGGTLSAGQIAALTGGTFSVDSDSWDYTVASTVADFLGQDETVSFSYLITVSDGKGGSDRETVTITLTGSNDAPVLTVDTGSGSITEDNSGTLEATGSLSFTDVDQNDEPTISASYNNNASWSGGTLSAGQIAALTSGTFSVDSDSWDYTVASTVADFLGQDETVSFSYLITVSDGKGGSDRETVTITLTGTNDVPVLTVDTHTGSITEDNSGTLGASGNLSFTDVDQNDEPTISASYNNNASWSGGTLSAGQIAALTSGTFSVDSDSWDYTVASTVADFLGQNETVSFSYDITVSDGNGGSDTETVTITLTGSNDAPVLTVDTDSGLITEDNSGTLVASGSLSFSDVDQNDEPTISASYQGDASWSGGTLSAEQIAGLTSGTFSVDSDSWDYTVASTVADFLGQDETVSFSYLITVSDGKGGSDRETVTITLTGTNDAPVLTVDTDSGSITEDNSGTLEASGNLSFTDVDQNDEPTISASYNNNASWSGGTLSAEQIAGLTSGTFSVDSDSWDYTVASTVADFLGQDETVSFSYLITVSDGKGGSDTETVTITLTGTNDAPVLTVDTGSGSITEDNSGTLEATGSLSFTDVDQNDEPTISASYNNNASWSGGTLSAGQIAALTSGTFSVDSDSWDYTVALTVADFLGQDETVSFSYNITVSDGKGGNDTETVTITLTGTNDAPVLTVDTHTGSITEDNSGTLGASGNLSFTDVDQNDVPTISASYNDNAIWSGGTLSAGQIAALTGGTFSVDSDSWDYTVASTVADFLGQDETVSFSYNITVSDGKGGSDTDTVTITLTGSNDAPVLTVDTHTGSITEDNSGTLGASGNLSFTDVDQNDVPTISASYNDNAIWSGGTLSAGQIAALTGGTFSVDSDSWDYTVASTVADFLGQDETVSFSYLITVSDGKGGSDRETVTITLTGSNDAPVLTVDTGSGSITEDNSGTLEATGSLSFTDVDQNDEPTISASYNNNASWSGGTLSAGQIAALTSGTFSVDSDSWDYTVASTVADFLGQDETVSFSYNITVSDGKGGSDTETVTITLTGSNDAPVLTVDTVSGSITEVNSGTLEASGNLSFTDVDQNDEPTISASYNNNASWSGGTLSAGQIAALTSGTFSVDSDSWDYTVARTVADFLGQDETVSFSYNITVSDGKGGNDTETVTITLTGTNDAPVLTVDTHTGSITEDNSGTLGASGNLSFTDVDQNDVPTISASYNDNAIWSGGTLSAGQIAALTGGTFSVDSDSWDYTVASTVADFLGQDETVSFSYNITVSDGKGGSDTDTVTITLTGSNDAPVLTVDTGSGSITEDNSGTLGASGNLSFTDVDQNDVPTISASYNDNAIWSGGTLSAGQIAALTSGTFSVDSDSWDYTVASTVADFLGQDETVSFSYLITVSDGKGGSDRETVTITLTGSNDVPVLTVDTGSGSITEDNSGTLGASGNLSFTDVDQNDAPTISASYNNNAIWSGGTLSAGQIAALTSGTFSVDSDSWDYTVASTVADFLGQDETVSFSYLITVSDGKGGSDRETVTITLTGTNDAPVLTVDTGSGSITEDNSGTLEATGSLSFTDVDQNDEPTISASYNNNASWSGGTLSAGQIAALTGGTFSVDSDSWDYTVASTVADFLGQDETVSFSYNITVSDGKGGSDRETVTITLTGSNDAPVLTVDTGSGSITEDNSGTLEATGSLSFTDVDQNDEPTISASYNNNASWSGGTLSAGQIAALTVGTFSVDSDSWDYTVASTVADFLGQDETVSFSYLITVSDGKGGSDRETVTITLTGSNDAPVLTVDTGSGSITEDNSGTLEATGSLSFTDVDQNDEPTISASYNDNAIWSGGTLSAGQIAALTGGTFSVDSDSWDYTVASTVADFLGQDETVSFSYLITVSDGKGGSDRETVTITLTGSNDAPVLTVDTGSGSITEDNSGTLEATGSLSFTDVDQNDEPTISASYNNNASWSGGTLSAGQIAALTSGTFSVDSDSWDYTVASTVADFLGQDETVSFSYLITVSDGKGGSDRETVTITLTGSNDAPVLTVDTGSGSITEDNSGTLEATGSLSFTDVDQNDEPTISASYNNNASWSGGTLSAGQIAALTGGTFSVDSDSWDYTVASTVADFLGQDETVSFSYLITVSDGKGGSDRETVTITLTGSNDAPVLTVDTGSGSITEDNSGILEATGSLSFTDVDQNDEPTISASYNNNASWSGGTLSAEQIAGLTSGTFSVDSDSWGYTVASTVADFLGQDETVSFSYLITVSDGKGGSDTETVTITLTGSNDAPVLTVDTGSGSITEDNSGTLEATGSLSFTDVDQNDEPTISASYNNNASWSGGTLSAGQIAALTSGTFSVDSDSWDYTVASTVADFLGQDETVSFSYLITVSDGKGGSDRETVTITLTGSNDAPVLTVDTGSGSITEDNSGTLEATGSLSFTDVDQNDEPTISASYNNNASWSGGTLSAGQIAALTVGTFSVDSDSWDYTVASTVADFLGQDETVSFSYNITVSDGKGGSDRETVTITLTGSNDAPVLTVDTGSGSITEDNSGTLEATGSLSFTDVDQNDAPTISASYNDNAIWSGGTLSAGQIAALTGGTFSVDSDSWDYTVASTVADFLGQDETVSFSYLITVSDGKGGSDRETVTITLTGTNDVPVLTVDTHTGSITEDNSGTLVTSGNLSFTDVDQNDVPTISASYNDNATWSGGTLSAGQIAALTGGSFSVDSDSWDYTVASSVADFLGQDETVSFSYNITVSDSKGGSDTETVTITLTGTNDAPVLTVDTHTGSITEDNSSTLGASGNLSFSDVDQNDAPTISASYNNNASWSGGTLSAGQIAALTGGTFSVDSDSWDYTVASSVADFLGQDETVSFSYLITVSDGKGGSDRETVTITLTGSNDAPVLTVDTYTGLITEDNSGTLGASGNLSFTDVDQNDVPTISASYNNNASWSGGTLSAQQIAALTSGTFSVDSDSWDYTLASTVADFLGQDETVSFSYDITVSDGNGGSDTETVTITLTGTNDKADVNSATKVLTETNVPLTTGGKLTSTDVDNPDNTFTPDSQTGTYGSFSIQADGSWEFTANSAFNELNEDSEPLTETFIVTTVDGTPSSVTITINGSNDLPEGQDLNIKTSTLTNGGKVGIDFTDLVSDIEDDDGAVQIMLSSLPDEGSLVFIENGVEQVVTGAMLQGGVGERTFSQDELIYKPANATGLLGHDANGDNDHTLQDWGQGIASDSQPDSGKDRYQNDTRQVAFENNVTATIIATGGNLKIYEPKLHIGNGLGVDQGYWEYDEGEKEEYIEEQEGVKGITPGESISVRFSEGVSYVEVGLDGMGGHFQPESPDFTNAHAAWTAYDSNGNPIGSGKIFNTDTDGDMTEQFVIDSSMTGGKAISAIEFTTGSENNCSSYEILYLDVGFTVKDGFTYVPVDSNGAVGEEQSVSVEVNPLNFAGSAGHDVLIGSSVADAIAGGAGEDRITGGAGNDRLQGGEDSDTFVFQSSDLIDGQLVQTDQLLDFTLGDPDSEAGDKLDLSGLIDFDKASDTLDPATLAGKGITAHYDSVNNLATLTCKKNTSDGTDDTLQIVLQNTDGWSNQNSDIDSVVNGDDVLLQLINDGQLIV